MAEKRAGEIIAMARQGKADKVATTTAKMDYQLDQAEHFINKYEEANNDTTVASTAVSAVPSMNAAGAGQTVTTPADKSTFAAVAPGSQQDNVTLPAKPLPPASRAAININRAKNTMNTTTAKSLAALQDALEKAPDSAKPALLEVIRRTKLANEHAQHQLNLDNGQQALPPGLTPNIIPSIPADKLKHVPPLNNNLKPNEPHPFNKPVLQNTLPSGGANNQTDDVDNSNNDNKYNQTDTLDKGNNDNEDNQTSPGTNLHLPPVVNPVVK